MSTFESFSAERRGQPNTAIETHVHPFFVQAAVVQGELGLTVGDRFELQGATFWVARRNRR